MKTVDKVVTSDLYCFCYKRRHKKNNRQKKISFNLLCQKLVVIEKILLPACLKFYLEIVFLQIKTAWSRLKLNFRRKNGLETKIARTFFGPLTSRAWIFRYCRPWSLKMSLASRRKGELHHSRHDHMLFKENSVIHVRKLCIFKLPLGHDLWMQAKFLIFLHE